MFPLAFVAGWLQGHWWGFISRNYVVWPTFLLMNVFIALKRSHFWFLLNYIDLKPHYMWWQHGTSLLIYDDQVVGSSKAKLGKPYNIFGDLFEKRFSKVLHLFNSSLKQVTSNTMMTINTYTKWVGQPFIDNCTVIDLAVGFCYTNIEEGEEGVGWDS